MNGWIYSLKDRRAIPMRWLTAFPIILLLVTSFSAGASADFPDHTSSAENEYPAAFYREAGLIANPAEDEDLQYLISEGLLDPLWPDEGNPGGITPTGSLSGAAAADLSYFKLKQEVFYEGLVVLTMYTVYVVKTTQEHASKTKSAFESIKSVATKIFLGGAGTIIGCSAPYIVDPPQHQNEAKDRHCSKVVRNITGKSSLAERVDRKLGTGAEFVIEKLHKVTSFMLDEPLLHFTIDNPNLYVHQGSKILPMTVRMDVVPQIKSNRTVIPIRYLEPASLKVSWHPPTRAHSGLVTLMRESDGLQVAYKIGHTEALTSEGEILHFDVAPFIQADRTFIGLRSALTPFCDIDWQPHHRRILIQCSR
jgi:hypothetical protein